MDLNRITTLRLDIKSFDNNYDHKIYNYNGMYNVVYNCVIDDPKLSSTKSYKQAICDTFGYDIDTYDMCVRDIKATLKADSELLKLAESDLKDFNTNLKNCEKKLKTLLSEPSSKDRNMKLTYLKTDIHKLKNKIVRKQKQIDNNNRSIFGGVKYVRDITRLKREINNLKKFGTIPKKWKNLSIAKLSIPEIIIQKEELLAKTKEAFKLDRIRPIYYEGRAGENGNRKIEIDSADYSIKIKFSSEFHSNVKFVCGKNQYKTLIKLEQMTKNKEIPITVRFTSDYISISFDIEKLNGYSFDKKSYDAEIRARKEQEGTNDLTPEILAQIKDKYMKDYVIRRSEGKKENRYSGFDNNPEHIAICIFDKIGDGVTSDETKLIFKCCFCLDKLNTSLGLSTTDPEQVYQNDRRVHEINNIWTHIFKILNHFKVANFVMEDLDFKSDKDSEHSKAFNKKINNLWHRDQTVNLIYKHCASNGINLIDVNPCYTSFIGNILHYEEIDPIAASMEICRRGMFKYTKFFYPPVDRIDRTYLCTRFGQDMSDSIENFVSLYKKMCEFNLRWRNVQPEKCQAARDKNVGFKKGFLTYVVC